MNLDIISLSLTHIREHSGRVEFSQTYKKNNFFIWGRLFSSSSLTYRRKLKWSYQIIFRIKEEEKEVFVFDVFHSRQDPAKLKKLLD